MILNPNIYREALDKNKDTIVRGIAEGPHYDILTIFSIGSHIPIAAVILYALRPEFSAPIPPLQLVLDKILDCYKYESVTKWSDL